MRKVSLEHSPARAFSASWAPQTRDIANQKKTVRVSSQNLLSQFFVPDVFVFRTGGLVALGSSRGRRVGEAAPLSLSSLSLRSLY
jgi:hypothetical protein